MRSLGDINLSELAVVQTLATALLTEFIGPDPADYDKLLDYIRPRDEDWARVFRSPFDVQAREGYAPFWRAPSIPKANTGQTDIFVTACAPAFALTTRNPSSELFPGGYAEVARAFQPDPIWLCWKFVEPGKRLGMAHNGLVQVEPLRFAWFPKPWRVLDVALPGPL